MTKLKYILVALLMGGFFFLASCVKPKSHQSEILKRLPGAFDNTSSKVEAGHFGHWWESFNDSELNRVLMRGFERNHDLEAAFARFDQAKAAAKREDASIWPSVNINGNAQRFKGGFPGATRIGSASAASNITGAGDDTSASNFFSASLAVSYELDVWGKLSNQRKAAQSRLLASAEELRAVSLSLSAEMAELYYRCVELRARLKLIRATIDTRKKALEIVEKRYAAGLVPVLDLHQARQNLARVSAEEPLIESDLDSAQRMLLAMTGEFPKLKEGDALSALPELSPEEIKPGIPSELLLRRPDLQAGLHQIAASDADIARAFSDRFPTFSLSASRGGSNSEIEDLFDPKSLFWNLILNLGAPVIDGGKRKAEVELQEARRRELTAMFSSKLLKAYVEVDGALKKYEKTGDQLKWLKAARDSSEENLRTALDSYQKGLVPYLQVIGAQQALLEVQSAELGAKRGLLSSRIQLFRALGGGWSREEIMERAEALKK